MVDSTTLAYDPIVKRAITEVYGTGTETTRYQIVFLKNPLVTSTVSPTTYHYGGTVWPLAVCGGAALFGHLARERGPRGHDAGRGFARRVDPELSSEPQEALINGDHVKLWKLSHQTYSSIFEHEP
eukprot:Skav233343  [mRNA]  locus=scaffold394:165670:166407:+ [translate_table: standard]